MLHASTVARRIFAASSVEPAVPPQQDFDAAELIDSLTAIAARAAQAIKACSGPGRIERKADGSPVTAADQAAEAAIGDGLARFAPAIPVVSEEQANGEGRTTARQSDRYFLVDPLDGTREFIAGRAEYTVNIALMNGGVPILAIVAAPALGLAWRGIVGRGADRVELDDDRVSPPQPIQARPRPPQELVILASRSHLDPRTRLYLDGFPQATLMQCGSSIKFCRIAEGAADLYPRLAPTHDWDIAAGHAVLVAAGGTVTALDGSPLHYGGPNLLIPEFIAAGKPAAH